MKDYIKQMSYLDMVGEGPKVHNKLFAQNLRDRFRAQGLFAVFDKTLGSEQCFGGKVQGQKTTESYPIEIKDS